MASDSGLLLVCADAVLVDPDLELDRVEMQARAPLDVRHSSLRNQPSDVTDGNAEKAGGPAYVDQLTRWRWCIEIGMRVHKPIKAGSGGDLSRGARKLCT
jgi:hypothetical protein